MNTQETFQPNWISAPGQTIEAILSEKQLSISDFALLMNTNFVYTKNLILGQQEINLETAKKLQSILGSTESFWMNRERLYRKQYFKLVNSTSKDWINSLPIKDMISMGWISKSNDTYSECLKFFNFNDHLSWKHTYSNLFRKSSFRLSSSYDSKIGATASWIRYGEIRSDYIRCNPWNPIKLTEKIDELKALSRKKSPKDFLPKIINICADCGVAVVFSKTPIGCPASGVVLQLNETKAMMLLSFRYLSDDQFWFTFFHELGHLLMHQSQPIFIEEENSEKNAEEREANIFAGEALIPTPLRLELKTIKRDKKSIVKFAIKAGVSPGIVIGQMQHEKIIPFNYLNGYKRRYNWEEITPIIYPLKY